MRKDAMRFDTRLDRAGLCKFVRHRHRQGLRCDDCHKLITISEIRFTCVLVVANTVLYIMLMYMVIVSRWRKKKKNWKKNTSTIFRDHYRVDSLGGGVGRWVEEPGDRGVHP
ncbi:hypothetical protein CY35_05G134400 [Sphagnum magellanicum]|nr:hypothetical protein CY35_05G134400 [Sphagnum magellanicum]